MLETIKELFTAHFDGEIKGCRYHSLAWWHEYRHKIQMDNKILNVLWSWLPCITGILGMIMILWAIQLKTNTLALGGLFIIPISVFMFILEMDAWIYSIFKKYFENKHATIKQ